MEDEGSAERGSGDDTLSLLPTAAAITKEARNELENWWVPLGSSLATSTDVSGLKHSVYRGREAMADPPIDLSHNLNDELPDGRPVKRFYAVQDFFLSYFHPDWRVDDSSPDDVLRHFASRDRKGAQQVAAEIDEIIDLDAPEDTIRTFVLARYALHYDPSVDGLTMRQWLRHARTLLFGEAP